MIASWPLSVVSGDMAERKAEPAAAGRAVRVCFVIDRLDHAGTEVQLVELIRRLNRDRVQPVLCLLDGEDEISRSVEPTDCVVLRLGIRSLLSPSTIRSALSFSSWLKREQIDVVQVHFPDSTYFGVLAARLAGIPVIGTRRNTAEFPSTLSHVLGRLVHRRTSMTIANCDAARRACIEQARAAPESVIVLPNGIDLARFESMPSLASTFGTRPPLIGAVANLRRVKGLDTFLRAAATVCQALPAVGFVVAGEGSERAALEHLIAELGLTGRCRLVGRVDDVPGFLADLDIAVLCSQSEGLSNALLEYMAAGRAIVATAVGGNPELIEHGVSGLLVAPNNPAELAEALRRLLDDQQLASRCGEAAKRKVTNFSWQAVTQKHEDVYASIVARSA
jgi:glycosyltransferase involved in cell wall biosynthesis